MELMLLVYMLNSLWVLTLAPFVVAIYFLFKWGMDHYDRSVNVLQDGGYYSLCVDVPSLKCIKGDTVKADIYSSYTYLKSTTESIKIGNSDLHRYLTVLSSKPAPKFPALLVGLLLLMSAVVPSKNTAVYMAGAYVLQEVATDDRTLALGSVAYNATMTQLKVWAESSSDLKVLLEQQGLLEKPVVTE